jgi:uncharacterized protein YndB with AHSA1/START domain
MPSVIQAAKPVVNTDVDRGTVQVQVTVPANIDDVWTALTKRDVVARWFGDLSNDLSSGANIRVDFGDADFFALENISLQPPTHMQYCWRFLGTGPLDAIAWEIVRQSEGGCLVTVTDRDPLRSFDTVEQLKQGWTDFLGRLQRFLTTGEIARYDWRRDFDGSIELPVSAAQAWSLLFLGDAPAKWLPFVANPSTGQGVLQNAIPGSSAEAWVAEVEWKESNEVLCQVRARAWANPTRCGLQVVPRATGSALAVRHNGWEEISSDPSYCMSQRREFANLWIRVLQQAKQLVGTGT